MAAHVLFIPLRETVCVSIHTVCVCACVRAYVRVCHPASVLVCIYYTVCVLEPLYACAYQCAALSATTHVVSHFEPLLSDSYRLDVCVAEASKKHLALCIPLEKVTLEDPR